jgi:hypothetical protein
MLGSAALLAAVFFLAPSSPAAGPHAIVGDASGPELPTRGALHCQTPVWQTINASDAFSSEVADDIPFVLAGQTIHTVTLWAAEWLGAWQDPDGLRLRFYGSQCPPPAIGFLHEWTYPWASLSPTFVTFIPQNSMTIYEITAVLPEPVTITTSMSLGAHLNMSWGTAAPFVGFCFSNPGSYFGCGELYWDDAVAGAPRWTPVSSVAGITADLAYCISDESTAAPEPGTTVSWGRVRSLFR